MCNFKMTKIIKKLFFWKKVRKTFGGMVFLYYLCSGFLKRT